MATRSGASEGINLISSIYSDDDDDMEDIEHQETPNDDVNTTAMENDTRSTNSEERDQQPQLSLSSPPLQQSVVSEPSRSRLHRLTIVDYGQDEVTLSPEGEDGEIVGAGVVMIGTQLQTTNGEIQEKTPPGTAQVLSPSNKTNRQLSQQPDASESHTMQYAVNVSESTGIEEAVTVYMETSMDIDPFDRFFPPPPMARCSDELQERINKFLYLKRLGKSYNAEVRKKKEYRNPDFLLHAVTYQDIDKIGSCFSKDVFDPHVYDKSDYYYEIGVPTVATGGLHPIPASVDSVARDVRQNKKSKWDKVDGDRRNPLHSGGQDSVSTASAHTALLTAANADNKDEGRQRRKDLAKGRWRDDHDPTDVTP
ncbi:uncharacterized protein LOC130755412 [Actinidia eriantha]|uniref:uncharacterized protein LOC130755412 n=1 Tax=Actinidia eriantha TaxID=165200 RepID=UPI00258D9D14|nr:uncharacterized protein LOC130755412 [Actinidia eriantha]